MNNLYQKPNRGTRDGFGQGLLEAGKVSDKILALTADLSESTRVHLFAKEYPERFIEVGIAEQNMMSMASGLALEGFVPFVSSYAVFSPGRSWDQLRVSVCYSKANVKIVGAHAGISVGPDGGTHQALEDIAITRVLPNLSVIVPCDFEEARKATRFMAANQGAFYLRLIRENSVDITDTDSEFTFGKINILREGGDVAIISCGPIIVEALKTAELFSSENISVLVANCHTVKPIDVDALTSIAKKFKKIVVLEEHQAAGGLGSAVVEALSEKNPIPVLRIGIEDRFGESGTSEELYKVMGVDALTIKDKIKKFYDI